MSGIGPIVLVGGFMSFPRRYRRMADALGKLTGSEVHVVTLTPADWTAALVRGYGQLVFEVATTVDKALLDSDSKQAVLVGHSAGGVAARVYIGGDSPFGGRRQSGYRRVSHLVTLGSPHTVRDARLLSPIVRANELFPGTLHEDRIHYTSIAGGAVNGRESAVARRLYRYLTGEGEVLGDGVVPAEAALLPGSRHLVLDDLYHDQMTGRKGKWYGSDLETVERWLPEELRSGRAPAR